MNEIHPLLKSFMEDGDTNIQNAQFPFAFVEKMLATNERLAREQGHRDEREEIVRRLFASGMSADEISLVLKIRVEEIKEIERYSGEKIDDYAKKLKARRKSREKAV